MAVAPERRCCQGPWPLQKVGQTCHRLPCRASCKESHLTIIGRVMCRFTPLFVGRKGFQYINYATRLGGVMGFGCHRGLKWGENGITCGLKHLRTSDLRYQGRGRGPRPLGRSGVESFTPLRNPTLSTQCTGKARSTRSPA